VIASVDVVSSFGSDIDLPEPEEQEDTVPIELRRDAAKNRLAFAAPVLDLIPENYEAETRENTNAIVLGFFTPTCELCKQLHPVFEELAAFHEGTLRFGAVDDFAFPEIGKKLGVKRVAQNLPAFVYMKPKWGVSRVKYYGLRTADDLDAWISYQAEVNSRLPLWKLMAWSAFHALVEALVAAFEVLEVEPTDFGSGGGPLSFGGNLGYAIFMLACVLIYVGVAMVILAMAVMGCGCCRPGPGELDDDEIEEKKDQ
jgi:thiol-disulfide isomerase/thioredoxin